MEKFRKKPVVITAKQWIENGDHYNDDCYLINGEDAEFKSEGKVVRYYRTPDLDGKNECKYCKDIMHNHGWIETLESGHIVCPKDWIIEGVKGEYYPCKPDIFKETYEAV